MVKYNRALDAVFAALSDPTRRAIVARLARGPRSVGTLAAPFDVSLAAVSKHLQVLERAGLVDRVRRGRNIECVLQPRRLKHVADWVGDYERFWTGRLESLEKAIREHKGRSS